MLKLRALRAKPHLLHRALLADNKELDKWFSSVARRNDLPYAPISEHGEWVAFKQRFVSQFGADNLEDDTPLSAYDAAQAIGIGAYYDTHYRGFSHCAHGLLEAISGGLDELIDPEASRVMLQSAITALDALTFLGAACPHFQSFNERAVEVLTRKPDKLLRQKPATRPDGPARPGDVPRDAPEQLEAFMECRCRRLSTPRRISKRSRLSDERETVKGFASRDLCGFMACAGSGKAWIGPPGAVVGVLQSLLQRSTT
jgi:hypothetical protein